MTVTRRRRLRSGIREESWGCATCGRVIVLFDPVGLVLWWSGTVAVLLVAGVLVATTSLTGGDRLGVAVLLGAVIAALVGVGARATWLAHRHPPA